MSHVHIRMTNELSQYLRDVSLREPDVLRRLRQETASHPRARMQITPEQGQFMQLLVRLIDAKRTVEIGVFTGYSALAVALALPANGQVVACDISEDFTNIARRYWAEAGVSDKISLRLAPAVETLDALLESGEGGTFDLVFIDADKTNYHVYYERALLLVRPGGLIAIDNVLWHGQVIDPKEVDADTESIRRLNRKVRHDERVDISVLPLGDGLTLARKR